MRTKHTLGRFFVTPCVSLTSVYHTCGSYFRTVLLLVLYRCLYSSPFSHSPKGREKNPSYHIKINPPQIVEAQEVTENSAMKVFEVDGSSLCLALYKNVVNSRELLNAMQSGTLEPEVAFLNASLIPDVFPLLAAAHKTLVAKSRESLTTRTLHSELVYNYSGSKHITESFKRCGISENSTYVLVARFGASLDEMKAVEKLIDGKEIDLEELEAGANNAQIQKHYKISSLELGISSLADAITCRIAARDAM